MKFYIPFIFLFITIASSPCFSGNFQAVGNNIIQDNETGLMWMEGSVENLTWEQALRYCEDLNHGGYDDWRLPNIKELFSLFKSEDDRIDLNFFPSNSVDQVFWTSTTYPAEKSKAICVMFEGNGMVEDNKTIMNSVKAVRGGK